MNKWIAIPVIAALAVVITGGGYLFMQETNKLEEVESEIVALEGNVATLEGNVATLEGDVSTLEGKLTESEATVVTLQTDLAWANATIKNLQADATPWWNNNWQYRKTLSFNTSILPFILDESFSIVLLPDTQFYSQSHPSIFASQTQWIAANVESENIKFVMHLGDIVNIYDDISQWDNADIAMSSLDGIVPYSVLAGNHDNNMQGLSYDNSYFNTYFGIDRFQNYSWHKGNYPVDGNENNYSFFQAGGIDFAVLSLEVNPSEDVLDWANEVVDSNPNRMFIVATHSYLHDTAHLGKKTYAGEIIWQSLIRKYRNIFLVASGHYTPLDPIVKTSVGDGGNKVFELIINYQNFGGGNGWLGVIEFSASNMVLTEYSPYLDDYDQVINFTDSFTDSFTDYPIIVYLDSSKVDFDKISDNGADIRFVDKDNIIALEHLITSWNDESENATLVVRIPQIDAESHYSDYIYMYYGNGEVEDGQYTVDEVLGVSNEDIVLNDPLYGLTGDNWTSPDTNRYLNTVSGTLWTPEGRSFDRVGDYISFSEDLMPSEGTIEGWIFWEIKASEKGAHQFPYSNFIYQHDNNNFLYLQGGAMHFHLEPIVNAWNYFAITWTDKTDSATTQLYINTVQSGIGQLDSYGLVGITGLARHSNGTCHFQGKIGEVKIYDRVLSLSEMQYNYLAIKWRHESNNIHYGSENTSFGLALKR